MVWPPWQSSLDMGGLSGFRQYLAEDELPCESRQITKTMDRKPGREEFLPAKLRPTGEITILNVIGSHANFGLLESDGLVRINPDVITLAQGEHIDFLPFPWNRNP